jgi:hypothetical protein
MTGAHAPRHAPGRVFEPGGHFVYPWVPRNQIWIEAKLEKSELPYLVAHEYTGARTPTACFPCGAGS